MQHSCSFKAKPSEIVKLLQNKSAIKLDRAPKASLYDSLMLIEALKNTSYILHPFHSSVLHYRKNPPLIFWLNLPLEGAGGQNWVDQDDLG